MEFFSSIEDGIRIISVKGYLESNSVPEFREKFFTETETDDLVIINCADLEYLDSSGLAAMVNIYKTLVGRNAKLIFSGFSEGIARVIHFTKLDKVFQLAADLEQAKGMLK